MRARCTSEVCSGVPTKHGTRQRLLRTLQRPRDARDLVGELAGLVAGAGSVPVSVYSSAGVLANSMWVNVDLTLVMVAMYHDVQAMCQALGPELCYSYGWSGSGTAQAWSNQCCIRTDHVWNPISQDNHVSGRWIGAMPGINIWPVKKYPLATENLLENTGGAPSPSGDQRTPAVFSRGSSPRPSIHADVRYIDDVIAFLRKTQLPQGMDADQLRVDGNRSPRARYPNANPETDQCKPHTNKQTQRLTAPPRNGRLKKGSCVLFSTCRIWRHALRSMFGSH